MACAICLERYSWANPARIIRNCGHDLCDRCLRRLILTSAPSASFEDDGEQPARPRCPSCRGNLIEGASAQDVHRLLDTLSKGGDASGEKKNGGLSNEDLYDKDFYNDVLQAWFPRSYTLTEIVVETDLTKAKGYSDKWLENVRTEEIIRHLLHRLEIMPFSPNSLSNPPTPATSTATSTLTTSSSSDAKLTSFLNEEKGGHLIAGFLESERIQLKLDDEFYSYADGLCDVDLTLASFKNLALSPFKIAIECSHAVLHSFFFFQSFVRSFGLVAEVFAYASVQAIGFFCAQTFILPGIVMAPMS